MALSNANGWIVLTTGNKSEMATGYSTLYGDSAGGFAVIKDVPKTLVYALCRYRNRRAGFDLIPDPVLTKAPSAELRPDQRDDESLPPYSVLDPVVAGYVEGDRSPDDLIAAGLRPRGRGPGGGPGRPGRVQAPADASRGQDLGQGLRQGSADAHHQPLPGRRFPQPRRRPGHHAGRPRRLSELTDPTRAIPVQAAPPTEAVSATEAVPATQAVPATEAVPPTEVVASTAASTDPAPPAAPADCRPPPLRALRPPPACHWPSGATAALVGEYRWIENALYSLLGQWVTDMPVAAVQIHLDAQSLRHAWHADLWADRLPVLSGVDPAGLTVPSPRAWPSSPPWTGWPRARTCPDRPGHRPMRSPSGRPGALPRLAGLYRVVLPRLVTSYERHLRAVSPVTDAPVARALRLVLNDEIDDWHAGERLVQRLMTRPHDVAAVHEFLQRLEIGGGGGRRPIGPGRFPRRSVPED